MNTFRPNMENIDQEKEIDVEKYRSWSSHLENTKDRTNYSIRRMDLLTISISGAGIYIVFETLKFFKGNDIVVESPGLLVFTGVVLLVAICANFASQVTGFYANHFEEKYTLLVLDELKKEEFDECEMKRFDKNTARFNKATRVLNIFSVSTMFLGLMGLFIFNYYLLF